MNCLSTAFPKPLRPTAYRVLGMGGRLGSISVQFVNGLLLQDGCIIPPSPPMPCTGQVPFGCGACHEICTTRQMPGRRPRYGAISCTRKCGHDRNLLKVGPPTAASPQPPLKYISARAKAHVHTHAQALWLVARGHGVPSCSRVSPPLRPSHISCAGT